MPTFKATPLLCDTSGVPANGYLIMEATSPFTNALGVITTAASKCIVRDGVILAALNGGPGYIPTTPANVLITIVPVFQESGLDGNVHMVEGIHRTVSVSSAATIGWDELVDVVPVPTLGGVLMPDWLTTATAAALTAGTSATTATSAAAAAEVSRAAAVVAKTAAEAVGTTNDTIMKGIDANASSAFRIQADARQSATYAPRQNPVGFTMLTFCGFAMNSYESLQSLRSTDGKSWNWQDSPIVAPVTTTDPTFRDPAASYVPALNAWLIAANVDAYLPASRGYFQMFLATDLLDKTTWTPYQQVSCLGATGGTGAGTAIWAPDLFLDTDGTLYVTVTINQNKVYQSSTTAASAYKTWSTFVQMSTAQGLSDAAPGIIDTCLTKIGSTYHLFYKLLSTGYIHHAISTISPTSGYTVVGTGNWLGFPAPGTGGYEGPIVVQVGVSRWRMYVDVRPNGGMSWTETTDPTLTTGWSALTSCTVPASNLLVPELRHGTVVVTQNASTTASSVVRENRALNCSLAIDSAHWSRAGSNTVNTRVVAAWASSGFGWEVSWSADTTGDGGIISQDSPVEYGGVFVVKFQFLSSRSRSVNFQWVSQNAAGADIVGPVVFPRQPVFVGGVVTNVELAIVPPIGAVKVALLLYKGTTTETALAGDKITISDLLVQPVSPSRAGTFFNGGMSGAWWTGTAGASRSLTIR